MKKIIITVAAIAASMILVNSCKKDEQNVQPPEPDNEVITTVQLKAVNAADSTDTVTAKWVKLNPADTSAPDLSHAVMNLKKSAVYNVSVSFLDETQSPAGDITAEVRDRANYHLVCFTPASGLNVVVAATDRDTHTPALPVGLSNTFTTGAVSSGALRVQLHHQPTLKTGDCSLGSIDADVSFTVNVVN